MASQQASADRRMRIGKSRVDIARPATRAAIDPARGSTTDLIAVPGKERFGPVAEACRLRASNGGGGGGGGGPGRPSVCMTIAFPTQA